MKDFIGVYPDAVDPKLCDWLISTIDQSSVVSPESKQLVIDNSTAWRNDIQLILDTFHPTQANELMGMVNTCLMKYIRHEVPILSEMMFISSIVLLQRTVPLGGGFHNWHCEDTGYNVSSRTMAWMVFLNDVEDGGETEFIYQQKRFKAEKGTVLIWPAGYTHMHRGNPPLSNKYIATGWYQGDGGSIYENILQMKNG